MTQAEKYIMEEIKKYLKTPEGKQVLKENGITQVKGGYVFTEEMQEYGEEMRDILYKHISSVIKSFKKEDIIINKPHLNKNTGAFISLSFKGKALKRPSLIQQYYSQNGQPDGVEDIILLFSNGYKASSQVYGTWRGKSTNSLTERKGDDFLMDAIVEFNKLHKGKINAKLVGDYAKIK